MKVSLVAMILGAVCMLAIPGAFAAQAEEAALAERLAAQADRFPNTGAAGPLKQALYEAAGRLAEPEIRFRRARFRAAELTGDADGMLTPLQEWRKLDATNLFVQMRLIDVYLTKLQTADARLEYARKIMDAESVDAQVRSHAAVHVARLQLEQSRTQAAMETLRKALLLNGLNTDAMNLQWQLSYSGSTPVHRVTLLLSMLKADPGSVDAVLRVAQELAYLDMVQPSLQWYAHASGMARPVGGLPPESLKDYGAELLISGQDRGAAEIGSYLLERDAADPGAWFLTLLAERGVAERIELVKKNALIGLLNRVAMTRAAIGAREATTRPLGTEVVSMPDLSGDAELLKAATPERRREYVAAVADVAWLLLYHDDKAKEAAPFVQAVTTGDPEDTTLHGRLQGWSLLRSGKTQEARALLETIADKDPLAAMGLHRILKQEPGDVPAATELATKLIRAFPARLIGAYVRAELGESAAKLPAEPITDAIRDLLDRFPQEILRMGQAPQDFITMRLQPQQVGHDFAEPMLVDVELRNLREFPLVIGSSGIARDVWLDVQLRGLLQQWVSGVCFEKIDGPVILPPGGATRFSVRMDRGPLSDLLAHSVQQSLQLSVFGLTNAVPTDAGIAPGPCGIRARMTQMLERRAGTLGSDAAMRRARATIEGNDAVAKLRLTDQLAAHLQLIADPQSPEGLKALDPEFRELMIRLSQDPSIPVRSWARYQMARLQIESAEKTASDLAAQPVWYARVLAALTAIDTPELTRATVLTPLGSDEDATVRHLSAAIPAALVKDQEPKGGN